jgi:dihydroorotase
MSENYSLIIKNGSCYVNGKLEKTDIALVGNKIKKIGKIEVNDAKVFDASNKIVLPGIKQNAL